MVAIQFTNRFFGFQPKVRECGQFLQNLRPELLGVFAARVEMPCKLVEVAAYLAALGRQGGKRRQCVLAALRHHDGVLDVHAVQDTADEFGLGEVEFFAGVCDPQLKKSVIVVLPTPCGPSTITILELAMLHFSFY